MMTITDYLWEFEYVYMHNPMMLILLGVVLPLFSFIIYSFLLHKIYQKADSIHAKLTYVPIFPINLIPFFEVINVKVLINIFLYLIPFLNILLLIKHTITFFEKYSVKPIPALLISILIPYVGSLLVLSYMAFSKEVEYKK